MTRSLCFPWPAHAGKHCLVLFAAIGLASGCGNEEERQENRAPRVQSEAVVSTSENTATVYQVVATDPDGDAVSFRISGGADGDLFRVAPGNGLLLFAEAPDFEHPADADADNVYELEVTATDSEGAATSVPLTVTVNDLPEAPVLNVPAVLEVEEEQQLAYQVVAVDPDGGPLRFSIEGGADQGVFSIDVETGLLRPGIALDFEQPGDANQDSRYELLLGARDEDDSLSTHALVIHVTEVNEAPVFTIPAAVESPENRSPVLVVTASDPEQEPLTFGINGGADASAFQFNGDTGTLAFVQPPNHEVPEDADGDNTYEVSLSATDYRGLTTVHALSVHVTDLARDIRSSLVFPPAGAHFGGRVEQVPLIGRLQDLEGGAIDRGDIDYIDVEGQQVTPDTNDPARWQLPLNLAAEDRDVEIEVGLADGSVHTRSHRLRNAPFFDGRAMVVDAALNRVLMAGMTGSGRIVAADLATGERTLAGDCTGVERITHLALRDSREQVVAAVVDDTGNAALWQIGLDGDDSCALVSDKDTGSGPAPGDIGGLILDEEPPVGMGRRAIIIRDDTDELLSVDLASGDRSRLSGGGAGDGPELGEMAGMALQGLEYRALIARSSPDGALLGVGLDNGLRVSLAEGLSMAPDTPVVLDRIGDRIHFVGGDGAVEALPLSGGSPGTVVPRGEADSPLYLGRVHDLDLDASSGRLVIAGEDGDGHHRILAAPTWSGEKTEITNNRVGAGPSFGTIADMAVDVEAGQAWVLEQDDGPGLMAVSLDQGVRSRLPLEGMTAAMAVAHDGENRRLLVLGRDAGGGEVVIRARNLPYGTFTEIYSFDTGTGPDLVTPVDLVADPVRDRLLVLDGGLPAVLAVDPASGEHRVVSDALTGLGPDFGSPQSLLVDQSGDRIVVADDVLGLMAVDPLSGDRADLLAPQPDGSNPDAGFLDIALEREGPDVRVLGVGRNGLRVASPQDGSVTALAHPGPPPGGEMDTLPALALDPDTGLVWFAGSSGRLLVMERQSGRFATLSR